MVAALLNRANLETKAILQSPSGGDRDVHRLLLRADKAFGRSLDEFATGRWTVLLRPRSRPTTTCSEHERSPGCRPSDRRAGLPPGDLQAHEASATFRPDGLASEGPDRPLPSGRAHHPRYLPSDQRGPGRPSPRLCFRRRRVGFLAVLRTASVARLRALTRSSRRLAVPAGTDDSVRSFRRGAGRESASATSGGPCGAHTYS